MTVGFLPLALVVTPIDNFRLVWVSFVFVALMPLLYAAFIRWGGPEPGFRRWQVLTLLGAYFVYVGVVVVFGSVQREVLHSGLNLCNPLAAVTNFNTKTQLLLLAHRVRPATGQIAGADADLHRGKRKQEQIVTDNLVFDVLGTVLLLFCTRTLTLRFSPAMDRFQHSNMSLQKSILTKHRPN